MNVIKVIAEVAYMRNTLGFIIAPKINQTKVVAKYPTKKV
jgi:hypothetical protein